MTCSKELPYTYSVLMVGLASDDPPQWSTLANNSATQTLHGDVGQDTWESLGQSLPSHVGQWDGSKSLVSHVGQWDGTDTWDKPCMTGHTGVPRTVPPIPCGTMGRDGHVGQSHVGWDDGSP